MTQPIAEVAFAALLGGLLGLPFRAFRRAPVDPLIAIGVGVGVARLLHAPWGWSVLAALSGAALVLLLPRLGAWRPGRANFARGALGGFSGGAARSRTSAPGLISRTRPSVLLDPADRLRIEGAVLEAERNTAGEIVVAVVGSCAEYESAGWRLGAAVALLGFLGAWIFAPEIGLGILLGAQAVGLVLGHARTAQRTGILIFVALFEHRVILLGDEGVDQVLDPDESWEEVVDLLLDGVREQRATEGILAAVRRCGEILQMHLPAPPRNLDQLPTALILED